MTGLANNCFCKSSVTCGASYGYGGYMDFESFDFYRDNFGVSPYYAVATLVGTIIPTAISVIALNWWRFKDSWKDPQETRVWDLNTSKSSLTEDNINISRSSGNLLGGNENPASGLHWLENHNVVVVREAHTSKRQHEVGYTISFSRSFRQIVQDCFKRGVECVAGCPLSWWPLPDPEDRLRPSHTRVYSTLDTTCIKGWSQQVPCFYDDIPTKVAEMLFPILVSARQRSSRRTWSALNMEAVHLRGTTLMRLLQKHTVGSNEQNQQIQSSQREVATSDRRRLAMTNASGGDRQSQGYQPSGIEEQGTSTTTTTTTTTTTWNKKPGEVSQPVVYLTVDKNSNNSLACPVALGTDDLTTFQNLRSAHRGLSLWTGKRASGIRFYRVTAFPGYFLSNDYLWFHQNTDFLLTYM